MDNLTLDTVSVWVSVNIHAGRLGFVLNAAEDRQREDRGFYRSKLGDHLEQALKGSPVSVGEDEAYGDVRFRFDAPTYEDLQRALPTIDHAIQSWKSKYRVATMKDSRQGAAS